MMKSLLKSIRAHASALLPNYYMFNYIIAVPYFILGNRRPPRNISSDKATINDYIFHRMIRNNWIALEKACVDKEYAKRLVLEMGTDVKIPATEAIYKIDDNTTVDDLGVWLNKFAGRHLVAKPTHSSGAIIFLDKNFTREVVSDFLNHAKKNYFTNARETQYNGLDRKIIIEENISCQDEALSDYKFLCSRGIVHYCQVDVDRFTAHKRAICTIPQFAPLPVRYGHDIPEKLPVPAHLDKMIEAAKCLSKAFDFVRVDLFDTGNGVYFGELTFSPCAGSDNISDEKFAVDFLKKVRMANLVADNKVCDRRKRNSLQSTVNVAFPSRGFVQESLYSGAKRNSLSEADFHVFAKLGENGLERCLEAKTFPWREACGEDFLNLRIRELIDIELARQQAA